MATTTYPLKDGSTLEVTTVDKIITYKEPVVTYVDKTVTYKETTTKIIPPVVVDPVPGTTIPFTPATIPFSDPDLIAPGRGAEKWHNGTDGISYPTETSNIQPLDVYYRFEWNKLWNASTNTYSWTYFDNLIKEAINSGQKFSFGIMSHRNDDSDGNISMDGALSSYPKSLHDKMKVEANPDFVREGHLVPNYNSESYLSALETLHRDIKNHLLTTRYTPTAGPNAGKSVLFADVIYCIDIRGFGNWGEWHTYGINTWDAWPAGRVPTIATLKRIIDAHINIFDRWQPVAMNATYGGGTGINVFHPYPEVSYYALTAKNAFGAVGCRRDQWGATDGYLVTLMQGNTASYGTSGPFSNLIVNKWKEAAFTGEPLPGSLDMSDLDRQVNLFHPTSIGNGNFGARPTGDVADRIRAAFKKCGYRLQINSGSITTGSAGKISINWQNVGIAPTYENWNVVFELRSGTSVVWTGNSSFKLRLFLPSATPTIHTDNFTNIPSGNYSLVVKIVDPNGYRQPLVLANKNRNADGSYTLK
jgi:hypothetical protein